jgi:hypothetical protein
MVRKASPVRVRQRALAKPLETAAFLVLGDADTGVGESSWAAFAPH